MTEKIKIVIIPFFIILLSICIFAFTDYPIKETLKCNNYQCIVVHTNIFHSDKNVIQRPLNHVKIAKEYTGTRSVKKYVYKIEPSFFYDNTYFYEFNAKKHANLINSTKQNFSLTKFNHFFIAIVIVILMYFLVIWLAKDYK